MPASLRLNHRRVGSLVAGLLLVGLLACTGAPRPMAPSSQTTPSSHKAPSSQKAPSPEATPPLEATPLRVWKFVSIPDFLNFDVDYPEPGWDEVIDFVLTAIADEEPDFILVPGDLVMGHWHLDEHGVEPWAERYYTAWKQRMEAHGLRYYTALGDHEIGDNHWRPTQEGHKLALVPDYKQAFREHLGMPLNGPAGLEGTAFWWLHENVLFVSLDVFDSDPRRGIAIRASEVQLAWLDDLMAQHPDVDHRVVMAHTPILGPVWKRSSSALFVEGGERSPLWQSLVQHEVDLYLCGEVHAITSIERHGVEQIAHGSLFGFNNPINYLLVTVTPTQLRMELKEIATVASGKRLWQTSHIRPRERLHLREADGEAAFQSVGRLVLDRTSGQRQVVERTGHFDPSSRPPPGSKRAVKLPKVLPRRP